MTAQRADELIHTDALPAGAPEERELAVAFNRGDKDAYTEIYERYFPRVLSVCRRMLGNPDDAQEAAQEAFLRIFQGLPRFNGRYRLGAWVVRIATNVCLDQLRARTRRPSNPTPMEMLDLESAPIDEQDPQILFLRNVEGKKVRRILESLPPMHRAAIVLRDFEGVSYGEIAETLSITECQVKALLHRARKGFRKSWESRLAQILLPFGLFRRLFGDVAAHTPDGPKGSHLTLVSETAAPAMTQQLAAASQAAQACGGLIQNCGQFVAEKAVPVLTAVVVGTATMSAVTVASRQNQESPPPSKRTSMAPVASTGETSTSVGDTSESTQPSGPSSKPKTKEPAVADDPAPEEPVAEDLLPAPQVPVVGDPTPAPDASPSPSPSPSAPPSPAPSEPEPSKPVYKQVPPVVGFDWGRPIRSRKPVSNYVSLNCEPLALEQRLETVVEDDDSPRFYPALLSLRAGKDLTVGLTVQKGDSEIPYTGAGELTGRELDGDLLRLEYAGSYETWNQEAQNLDLPRSGPFTVSLFLDCATATLIEEIVSFGT
jgi:RNA polymerase sigma-70 factor (ECF subfamily)